jgi:menaquinone-dependent protoporphyrinogen oxidase
MVLGSSILAAVGSGVLLNLTDPMEKRAPIGYPEQRMIKEKMSNKVLVTYASAAGSTGGVAEIITQKLVEKGLEVDLQRVEAVKTVEGYDGVILGSAIHGGKCLPEAAEFVEVNQANLNKIPTLFFSVGLMMNNKSADNQKLVEGFLAPQRALVKPAAEGCFSGAMFLKDHPFFTRMGMRFFIAYCGLGFRGGDFRDPAVISRWAEEIYPLLKG